MLQYKYLSNRSLNGRIFPLLAKEFRTTVANIESAMRFSLHKAEEEYPGEFKLAGLKDISIRKFLDHVLKTNEEDTDMIEEKENIKPEITETTWYADKNKDSEPVDYKDKEEVCKSKINIGEVKENVCEHEIKNDFANMEIIVPMKVILDYYYLQGLMDGMQNKNKLNKEDNYAAINSFGDNS